MLPLLHMGGVAGLALQNSYILPVLASMNIYSSSRESGGCSTEGEQYAAWPPVCVYLWSDEGIWK